MVVLMRVIHSLPQLCRRSPGKSAGFDHKSVPAEAMLGLFAAGAVVTSDCERRKRARCTSSARFKKAA
jgi:hypothetical protein